MMQIYTSFYANKNLCAFDGSIIRISKGAPRWRTPYIINGGIPELSPSRDMIKLTDKYLYQCNYIKQLELLGFNTIMDLIKEKSNRGSNIALLCFENLHIPENWCHRTMLAEWLNTRDVLVREM